MMSMFIGLDGQELSKNHCVAKAYEVYNPALASNFAAQRSILAHRFSVYSCDVESISSYHIFRIQNDPQVFSNQDWRFDRVGHRSYAHKDFDVCDCFSNVYAGELSAISSRSPIIRNGITERNMYVTL